MNSALRNIFEKIDLYGYKVPLSFKGKTSFTTPVGSLLTFILVSCVILFGGFKAAKMFNREASTITSYVKQNKYEFFDVALTPVNELGFDFAVQYDIPARYGKLVFTKEVMENRYNATTNKTDFIVTDTDMEIGLCGDVGLNHSSQAEMD